MINPVKIFHFFHIVSFGMLEETGVPKEIHRLLISEFGPIAQSKIKVNHFLNPF